MSIPHFHSSTVIPPPVISPDPQIIPYTKCIAKTAKDGSPGSTVINHSICTAEIGRVLYRRLPKSIRDHLPKLKLILLILALHDVGKIIPRFQRKLFKEYISQLVTDVSLFDDETLEKYHARVSEIAVLDVYKENPYIRPYAKAEGYHHGKRDVDYPDSDIWKFEHDYHKNGGPSWAEERRKFIAYMENKFGKPCFSRIEPKYLDYLMAFIVFCDWLASDEHNFDPAIKHVSKNTHAKALESVNKLGWIRPKFKKGLLSFKQVFTDKNGVGMNPYPEQKAFLDRIKGPGVYIFQNTTGRGKTETALYAGYKLWCQGYNLNGMYMAMPTRITSDRIFKRADKFFRRIADTGNSTKILHGQNILSDMIINGVSDTATYSVGKDESQLKPGGAFFSSNRKALILPFAVGTIDQLLLMVIQSRFSFFRSFGISGKVVILDEIHSYDAYTGKLVDYLIKRLVELECTVIILSATLTAKRKCQLLGKEYSCIHNHYPLMTTMKGNRIRDVELPFDQPQKTVKVKRVVANIPLLIAEAVKRASKGQVVMMLFNSVDRAVDAYLKLDGSVANKMVMHSRFPLFIRIPRENQWLEKLEPNGSRPNGCIIIGTQVLEQSLDIDVDFLITELAPIDFLIQRIGRLWRFHNLPNRAHSVHHPEVWIFSRPIKNIKDRSQFFKIMEPTSCIYDEFTLYRTHKALKSIKQLIVPNDITPVIEHVYRDYGPGDPKWLKESYDRMLLRQANMRDLAYKARGKEYWEEEDADIGISDDFASDYNLGTRRMSLASSVLLLTKSMHETETTVDIDLMDGTHVTIVKEGEINYQVVKILLCNVVKVVDNKILKEYKSMNPDSYSPEWLKNYLYGRPIPVCQNPVTFTLQLYDGCSTSTGYRYTDDLGAYKPLA